jgi:hypothetical protein
MWRPPGAFFRWRVSVQAWAGAGIGGGFAIADVRVGPNTPAGGAGGPRGSGAHQRGRGGPWEPRRATAAIFLGCGRVHGRFLLRALRGGRGEEHPPRAPRPPRRRFFARGRVLAALQAGKKRRRKGGRGASGPSESRRFLPAQRGKSRRPPAARLSPLRGVITAAAVSQPPGGTPVNIRRPTRCVTARGPQPLYSAATAASSGRQRRRSRSISPTPSGLGGGVGSVPAALAVGRGGVGSVPAAADERFGRSANDASWPAAGNPRDREEIRREEVLE